MGQIFNCCNSVDLGAKTSIWSSKCVEFDWPSWCCTQIFSRWPCKFFFTPPLTMLLQTRSHCTYQATQDSCQMCWRFHRIWKMILEISFSAHYTSISSWIKFLGPVLWKLYQNVFNAVVVSSDARRHPEVLAGGGKLCSGTWNRALDGHIGTVLPMVAMS